MAFVRDYVEMHFDGPILRMFNMPGIDTGDGEVIIPAPGSRDAICSLIGLTVRAVQFEGEELLFLKFDGGRVVRVFLSGHLSSSGEAAHYVSGTGAGMEVW